MDHELETMPKALRLLADQISAPDHVPAMCLRDAAAMIESLAMQRERLREIGDRMAAMLELAPDAPVEEWPDDDKIMAAVNDWRSSPNNLDQTRGGQRSA